MKYILMMNTPGGGPYQVAQWPREDLVRHIEFMKAFATKLGKAGELVGAEGLAGPDQAKRVRAAPIFAKAPQQSDYTPRWTDQPENRPATTPVVDYSPSRPKLANLLPGLARLCHVLKMGLALYRNQTLANRKCYQPVKKP